MTGFIDHFINDKMSFLSQIGKNKVEDKLVKLTAQITFEHETKGGL